MWQAPSGAGHTSGSHCCGLFCPVLGKGLWWGLLLVMAEHWLPSVRGGSFFCAVPPTCSTLAQARSLSGHRHHAGHLSAHRQAAVNG